MRRFILMRPSVCGCRDKFQAYQLWPQMVRRIENGWSEVRPDETGNEYHRNVFGEQVMTSGVWAAVVRVCAAKDDKPGGIFVGIAPDGANPSVPLGDRSAATAPNPSPIGLERVPKWSNPSRTLARTCPA